MNFNVFWFRRDLRLHDNAGLYHALKQGVPVQCLFIFDKNILDELPKDDQRVTFIHDTIIDMAQELESLGSSLWVYYGKPLEIWKNLLQSHNIAGVYANKDFEQYAKQRDDAVKKLLSTKNLPFSTYKDHVVFEGNEVLKDDGKPYTIFTPYKNKWLSKLHQGIPGNKGFYLKPYPTHKYFKILKRSESSLIIPDLKSMGFIRSDKSLPSKEVSRSIIKNYTQNRDFPSINGTSKLGIHYRFGTISIREKASKALILNDTYLSELIWRDFYAMILYHFPYVQNGAFRPEYDRIQWVNNETHFEKWKEGKTGYPMVDAGMRELNTTGYMHNRVRMITASFLTKHLLIDWRWGEAYFAEKLIDFDLASNNGGWQWAAGCGTDAAPYFRIFNPQAQQEKFDPELKYIKKWIPEYGSPDYPKPIVDHKQAREKCLATYNAALKA